MIGALPKEDATVCCYVCSEDELSVSEVSGGRTHTRWMSRGYKRRERNQAIFHFEKK